MADSKVIKVVKSSQLLSNLSTMKDEVRDRTIFVQVTSECHSWSDVEIVALFSEFGRVEEVKLLSTGNHFHSQIRYQTEYDRECACYYYQDGWLVHQNCCEIQVYRAEDIVCVNAQRIDNIQAANVISANSKVLNSTGLLEETLMNKEVVSQAEESTQLLPEDSLDFVAHYVLDQMPKKEPNSAHDSSGLAALKVFEEMPGSTVNGELILVDEIANKNEEPLDDILECVICFDPGGSRLIESDHAISLSNMGCEDEVAKAEKSTHIWKNEQVTVKEFSYFADQRMLNEMLKSKKCCEVELSAEFRTFATPWAESSEDILALERQNSTVTVIKAFREVMMVFDMGNLSFDPGGLMLDKVAIEVLQNSYCHRKCYGNGKLHSFPNDLHIKEFSLSAFGLSLENAAGLNTFCFDLGGLVVKDEFNILAGGGRFINHIVLISELDLKSESFLSVGSELCGGVYAMDPGGDGNSNLPKRGGILVFDPGGETDGAMPEKLCVGCGLNSAEHVLYTFLGCSFVAHTAEVYPKYMEDKKLLVQPYFIVDGAQNQPAVIMWGVFIFTWLNHLLETTPNMGAEGVFWSFLSFNYETFQPQTAAACFSWNFVGDIFAIYLLKLKICGYAACWYMFVVCILLQLKGDQDFQEHPDDSLEDINLEDKVLLNKGEL